MSKHIDTGHGLAVSDITDDQLRNAAEYSCYASQTDVVQMARDLAAEVLRLRTAAPGMAWVATSEGLPEGAWPVLVAGNFYSVRQLVAWYCREMNGEPAHWESRGESWPVEQVTHWMELPPAPETGEGR